MKSALRSAAVAGVSAVLGMTLCAMPAAAAEAPGAAPRAYVAAGFTGSTVAEARRWLQGLAEVNTDGPVMRGAIERALAGSDEDLLAFAQTGYQRAFDADELLRVGWVLRTDHGPAVESATQDALRGDAPEWTEFLTTGLAVAQAADDRIRVAQILDGEPSPEVAEAARAALLDGSPEALAAFLATDLDAAQHQDDRVGQVAAHA